MKLSPLIERQVHAIETQTRIELSELVMTANFSAIVGQTIVAIIWSTFARRPLLWKFGVLFLFACPPFWLFTFTSSTPLRRFELLPPLVIAATLPIFMYRYIGGWEITKVDSQTAGDARQINIADLGTITLLTAVTIASLQHYESHIDPNRFLAGIVVALMWVGAATTLAMMSCVVLPLLFLLMDSPSRWRKAVSYGIIVMAAVITTGCFSFELGLPRACVITFCLVAPVAFMATASMSVLRRLGYRLRRHAPKCSAFRKSAD